ncbi:hypothetical protein PENANT_c016G07730 [Penicillium antarcticum]|uniref:Amino acid transporter transmembrane domain-containing protein n=1 Tax=Penicillium antarcticum TaxID=416450 RepID=A0A1V6Q2R9_9EURO|nr:hypothetical protein PENANT_c016G07730 [Penicillium antarcticum]
MIGQVKLANPSVHHYGDAGTLMMGRFGYELFTIMFLLQLIFVIGSHCLTGSIALVHITTSGICSLVFGIVSAVILFLLAVPSSFADAATLGYIDFASVIIAIEIAIISTGTQATNAPGGLAAVSWSALPKENLTFSETRVAFGIALPVIFISGSINTIVAGRLILSRAFKNSVVRYVNTAKGWAVWLMLISCVTIVAWVLAEAIPFFNDLIGNTSALFTSGFSFYIPPIMWFVLIRKGKWYSKENILLAAINAFVFIFGVAVLVCGLYSTIEDIRKEYHEGSVRRPFSCVTP